MDPNFNLSNLHADSSDQYHLYVPFQSAFDLSFSDTTTHTTPSSVPGSADQVKQYVLPIRDTCDSTIVYAPARSSGEEMTPFPDENSSQQGTTATDDWSVAYPFSETDKRDLSPASNFQGRNMIPRKDGGVGHRRTTSSSQVVEGNDYPDLTSNWTWNQPREGTLIGNLENMWLSAGKRLSSIESRNIEPRNHACGWHCPICNQRLKRRDYIKPHVKRKHPERYDGLYWTPSSNQEQSIAAPADCPSAHDGILDSGLLEGEGRPPPMFSWDPQLEIQRADAFRSHLNFLGGSITPQKRSLDSTSPDGSENESSSRLKTSHDSWARSLACPFYKHYPFQHRKCLALSLRRPKDVKQHIYRSHTMPEFYCARCFHIFHSATDRDTHWRESVCDRLDGPLLLQFQGITEDQRKLLNEKSPRELDVEDQWFQIYGIIFPGSERPRSAYVGNCLEEIVPLLRKKWDTQGSKITARTVGGLSHPQLSFAMDLFFQSLEGETFENETDDNSICAVSVQSQMGHNSQQSTWPIVSR